MAKKIIIAELDIGSKDLASANAKLLKQMTALKERQKEVRKATNNLTNANQKQLKSYVNTDAELKKLSISYNQQKNVLVEVTTGVRTLEQALTKEVRTLNEAAKNTRKLTKLKGDLNIKNKDGKRALDAVNQKLDANSKFVKKNSSELERQRLNIGNYSSALDKVVPGLGAFITGLISSTSAIKGTVLGLKTLKIALLATGIGALIVLLGAIIAGISRFTIFTDALSVELAGLSAAMNVILDRLGRLGFMLIALGKGDWDEVVRNWTLALEDFGDEIVRETLLARELKKVSIELERDSKLFEAHKEAVLTEIQELRAIARDRQADDQVRLAAIQRAGRIELGISKKSLEFADKELASALDQFDWKTKTLKLSAEALDFVERIRAGTIGSLEAQRIAKELTNDDADAKGTLFEVVDKMVAREKEMQGIVQKRIRIQFTLNTVEEQILIKKIAGLKAFAKLYRLQSEDEKLSIKERVELIEKAFDKEMEANLAALEGNKINQTQFEAERLILIRTTQQKIDQISLDSAEAALKIFERRLKKQKVLEDRFIKGRKLAKEILFEEELLRLDEEGASRTAVLLVELDERERLEKEAAEETIENKKILERKLKLIEEQFRKEREDITKSELVIKLEAIAAFLETASGLYQNFSQSIIGFAKNALESERQLTRIAIEETNRKYAREIKGAEGNAFLIAQINRKKEAAINKIKERQRAEEFKFARTQKRLAISQAIITTALAVVKALASFPYPPLSIPQAIAAGAFGLFQVAVIRGQPLPRLAKGTARVRGDGSDTSDSIPALLSKNERIVDAANNRKIGFDLSNDQLASAAMMYRSLLINRYTGMTDRGIITEIKALNKTLKNKPISSMNIQVSEGFKVINRNKYLT